ncbi:LysR family transcriptional regulator substrate-binding protein [Clostridium neuense]|uniref:LysR family transcriptional regulator substrate-binding protein n=1 Tax=Clostridium neuense TaxID=1728934 RepID=A0ABW8TE40_9CLOT
MNILLVFILNPNKYDDILDIGFVYTELKSNKFQITHFSEDEIILITCPNNKSKVFYKEVSNLPLLYTDLGENFFEWLSSIFGDSPLLKLSTDETSYVIDFVKAGFGYAFVTKSSVKSDLLSGELIQVKIEGSLPPERQIYMIINKSRKDSIAVKNFLKIV